MIESAFIADFFTKQLKGLTDKLLFHSLSRKGRRKAAMQKGNIREWKSYYLLQSP